MASSWLYFDTTFTLIAIITAEKWMFEECVFGGGKLVGWPVHIDFLRPTVREDWLSRSQLQGRPDTIPTLWAKKDTTAERVAWLEMGNHHLGMRPGLANNSRDRQSAWIEWMGIYEFQKYH